MDRFNNSNNRSQGSRFKGNSRGGERGEHRGGDRGDRSDHRGGGDRGDHRGGDRGGRHSGPKPVSIAVQDPFLNTARREQVALTFVMVNGEKRDALIDSFDQNTLLVYSVDEKDSAPEERGLELIYKHSVAEAKPKTKIVRTYAGIASIERAQERGNNPESDEYEYETSDDWQEKSR